MQGPINERWKIINYCYLSLNVILIGICSLVIIMLHSVMKRMPGNFDKEIRSIHCQFSIFLLAAVTCLVELITYYILETADQFTRNSEIILGTISAFVSQILPTFIILLLHYKAFNSQTVKKWTTCGDKTEPSNLIQTNNFEFISQSSSQEYK